MKVVGQSPAALEGYLSLNGALAKGVLDVKVRERIALAVAEFNRCTYCLSAHTYLAQHAAKLDAAEIALARDGHANDSRTDAALIFARAVLERRGAVEDADLAAARQAGLEEPALLEIVVNVALNVLTNYVNNVAQTTVDFPVVEPK
jgi:AhpD family alkylhydroperoxidase